MYKSTIYLPDGISDRVKRTVRNHVTDEFGGYTEHDGRGGWKAPSDELVTERVTMLEVVGMGPTKAESTANWVADMTDETEVMWECQQIEAGFETGNESE